MWYKEYIRVGALPVSRPLLHVAPRGAASAHTARTAAGHETSPLATTAHHT